jgi:hypothetical protein
MAGWLQVVIGVFTLVGAGGGLYALLTVPQQKRKIDADTTRVVADTVEDLLGSARDQIGWLKGELTYTQTAMVQLHRNANNLQQKIDTLQGKLDHLVGMIHDPYMTLDRLRVIVPQNGNSITPEEGQHP